MTTPHATLHPHLPHPTALSLPRPPPPPPPPSSPVPLYAQHMCTLPFQPFLTNTTAHWQASDSYWLVGAAGCLCGRVHSAAGDMYAIASGCAPVMRMHADKTGTGSNTSLGTGICQVKHSDTEPAATEQQGYVVMQVSLVPHCM